LAMARRSKAVNCPRPGSFESWLEHIESSWPGLSPRIDGTKNWPVHPCF
jgi:hypothetical protein